MHIILALLFFVPFALANILIEEKRNQLRPKTIAADRRPRTNAALIKLQPIFLHDRLVQLLMWTDVVCSDADLDPARFLMDDVKGIHGARSQFWSFELEIRVGGLLGESLKSFQTEIFLENYGEPLSYYWNIKLNLTIIILFTTLLYAHKLPLPAPTVKNLLLLR